jgi:uncharacterized repeat protein (TIGR01451 family)
MKSRLALFLCSMAGIVFLFAVPVASPLFAYLAPGTLDAASPQQALANRYATIVASMSLHSAELRGPSSFDPAISLAGALAPGALGLPGEQVIWVITVNNPGPAVGSDLIVTDTLRDELRIEHAEADQGEVAISEQTVVFTVPVLKPGDTVQMRVLTTIQRSPANGVLLNQALLAVKGPGGAVARNASAELFVPDGLPATGYPPAEDLPGQGEPSAVVIGLGAFGVVALTALFVWYRGRRG